MKLAKVLSRTVLVLCLSSATSISPAATITYLSNLANSSWGGYGVNGNWGLGQEFQTGTAPGGYSLNLVTLSMLAWSEGVSNFQVSVYSSSGGMPNVPLQTLSGSDDPRTTGLYDYTSPGITLSPGTPYWIVATASGAANGFSSYGWEITRDAGFVASDGWQIPAGNTHGQYYTASGTWTLLDPSVYGWMKIAVNATPLPVPEPASFALIRLGLGALGCKRCPLRRSIKAAS